MRLRFVAPLALGLLPSCLVSFEDDVISDGPGLDGVVRIDEEPAGEKCPAGGVIIVTGIDADKDGVLSSEEESGIVSVVCGGQEGAPAKVVLLRIAIEAEGEACPNAGQRVESGLDDDGDDLLDDDEVESVRYLCNGAPGARGGQALVVVTDEPAGANCAFGGARLMSGIDQDDDAVLDENEVAATSYACDGASGTTGPSGEDGLDALVDVVPEAPGLACPAGGQRVNVGIDEDADTVLSQSEITTTSYVCNGRSLSSGGTGGELSGGVSEGTVDAPVTLTPGAFAVDDDTHRGTVGAGFVSYYRFTTLSDPVGDAGAPYSLAFSDVEADVGVQLYANADFATSPLLVECAFEAARLFVCSTAPLAEGTTYYAVVSEMRNIALSYDLSVSFGARTGTGAAPAAPMTNASVHGGGVSYFDLGGSVGDIKTVRISNVRGAPSAPPILVWEQLNEGAAYAAYGTCSTQVGDEIACPTGRLGSRTILGVRETSGAGALFDLVVENGDTITPARALGTLEPLDSPLGVTTIVTFTTPNAGAHTVAWRRAAGTFDTNLLEIYPDRLSADARVRRITPCAGDCVATLSDAVAPGPVYFRAPTRLSGTEAPHNLALFSRGGNQGVNGAPHPLPVGVSVEGSLASSSLYSLPAPAATVRYSVEIDTYFTGLRCAWYGTDTFSPILYEGLQFLTERYGCISEPVPAGQPMYLVLSTSPVLPVAYTLQVHEGDAITPELAVGSGVSEVVSVGGYEYRQLTSLSPGPYAITSTTTGSVRRRVFPGNPRNLDWTDHVARCESNSRTSTSSAACTLRFVAKESVPSYYLEILVNGFTVTLDPVAEVVHEHVVGTPTVYAAPANESVWMAFDVPSEGGYELDVTQSAAGSYATRVYGPGYETIVHSSSTFSGASTLVTYPLGALTPGRWAVLYDSSGSGALDVTIDVREVP